MAAAPPQRATTEAEGVAVVSQPPYTWSQTVLFGLGAYSLYSLNILNHFGLKFRRLFTKDETGPDVTKSYECRPSLTVGIFYPPSHNPAAPAGSQPKLPTLFTVHGGGFVIGIPEDCKAWNYDFVRKERPVLVVSLDYRKAPAHPFPTAIHDLEALILAVLADDTLPIDHSRVAIGGWSAGGNLALSVSSLPSMRNPVGENGAQPRIHAAVPIYPVVDISIPLSEKVRHRPYKPFSGFRGRKEDYLARPAPVFNWAYLPSGFRAAALVTPLLSPTFLPRESLPPYVFLIACELDMLARESWQMACKLAGKDAPTAATVGSEEIHPQEQLILDDERFAFETRTPTSSYKWLLVPDAPHAFDMEVVDQHFKKDEMHDDLRAKREACMTMISDWLFSGPFAERH